MQSLSVRVLSSAGCLKREDSKCFIAFSARSFLKSSSDLHPFRTTADKAATVSTAEKNIFLIHAPC